MRVERSSPFILKYQEGFSSAGSSGRAFPHQFSMLVPENIQSPSASLLAKRVCKEGRLAFVCRWPSMGNPAMQIAGCVSSLMRLRRNISRRCPDLWHGSAVAIRVTCFPMPLALPSRPLQAQICPLAAKEPAEKASMSVL